MTRRELEDRLREVRVAGEDGAEERAWRVIRAAHAERTPAPRQTPVRRVAVALAASLAVLAVALSPAGAEVVDVVRDVVGVDDAQTRPGLDALPASGELLVDSGDGIWIVRADGSKRRLGDYEQATWSPRGLFVAAAAGNELVALEPDGEVRWTVTTPAEVRDPRWSPSGFRVAYLSGGDLRVVAGDGTGDSVVARDVASVAPAWRPVTDAKLGSAPGAEETEQVSYVDARGRARLVDADSGAAIRGSFGELFEAGRGADVREIEWSPDGTLFLSLTDRELRIGEGPVVEGQPARGGSALREAAISPDGSRAALIESAGNQTEIRLLPLRDRGGRADLIFSGPGAIDGATWSPDGRWLLASWRTADQWLFIRADRPRRLVAIDDVSAQFDPGDTGTDAFPRAGGWALPQR